MIIAIVIINAFLGIFQENKAHKAIEALKNMSEHKAKVIRNGKLIKINSEDVVVGDILILDTGDYICADGRLFSHNMLKVTESSLTGESIPVEKNSAVVLNEGTLLADKINMVFSGSYVQSGNGKAIVTATGMNSEVGKIANLLVTQKSEQTPLQNKLSHTGKILGIGALFICFIVFIIGLFKNIPPFEIFITSVSLAVAAIPEGLPAIVTIMLALGVEKMAKRNTIIRNLPAVETLGSASVICSDKTGTLTQNKMKVTQDYTNNSQKLYTYACLCSNVGEDNKGYTGDATEICIVEKSKEIGLDKKAIESKYPRVFEIPFDSERKMMTTVHKYKGKYLVITKGAEDFLIDRCKDVKKNEVHSRNIKMANNALRVIMVCYKEIDYKPSLRDTDYLEKDLSFLGLIGMMDPPKREAIEAVRVCRRAGIKPVMITGDHIVTAKAIGEKIGIYNKGDKAITGEELIKTSQKELEKNIFNYSIYARVSPEDKVRIVNAFKNRGACVCMTGDGVNDAPALKSADIGCAMGIMGTDVCKGAADMILTDDNFATIVDAVKEGRGIFDNIKKSIHFLLSSNIGEILTILITIISGGISPLSAIHLLWVNLVTDSLPAIALGLDPVDEDIMDRKPNKRNEGLFNRELWIRIVLEGIMIGLITIIAFNIGVKFFDDENSVIIGRTMAFCVLSISQLVHAFNMRSEKSLLTINPFSNKYLCFSFLVGFIMQTGVVMIPALSRIFKVYPLNFVCWLIVLTLSFLPIGIVEIEKAVTKD